MEGEKPKISNLEWGLIIGALLVVDLTQILIEWALIWVAFASVVINFCIDLAVGMSLAFYLQLRGQSMASPKRLFGLLGTFGLEMIPGVDELPLWCLDGVYNMLLSKSEQIIKIIPVADKIVKTGEKVVKFVPKARRYIGADSSEDNEKAA